MEQPQHNAEGFYDAIAGGYDGMISFATRLERARDFVGALLLRFPIPAAVDVGCGTGVYALALAERGVKACGVDLSAAMLDEARRNGRELDLDVNWHHASMDLLPAGVEGANLLLCMGNTLPHLLTDDALHNTLLGFHAALAPDGRIAIHLLNYDAILDRQERIVGVSHDGDIEYTRYYDFLPPYVRFNLQTIDTAATPPTTNIHSTTLWPYTQAELRAALARAGFGHLHAYSGLDLEPYDPAASDTLLLIAQK